MGRIHLPTASNEDWRERLLWTSLAVGLIAVMLLALVSLARWGERSAVASSGPLGVDRLPGSTALTGELLIAPSAFTRAREPLLRSELPAVGTSLEAGSAARFRRTARVKCKPVPGVRTRQAVQLVETDGELCAPAR